MTTKIGEFTLGLTGEIIAYAHSRGVLRNQLAYMLATAYWESGRTMMPVLEKGNLKSKKYYPYIGRGLVQVTWSYNYKGVAKLLGLPVDTFIKDPDKLLEPGIAVKALVEGMISGLYTSKKIGDYFTVQKSDWLGGRRIINGTDRAQEIADIAQAYDKALLSIGYGVGAAPRLNEAPIAQPTPKSDNTLLTKAKAKLTSLLHK